MTAFCGLSCHECGCLTQSGNVFNYSRICEIRKCGKEKGVENCAHCSEYVCEKLKKFFKMVPQAKKRLDEVRNTL